VFEGVAVESIGRSGVAMASTGRASWWCSRRLCGTNRKKRENDSCINIYNMLDRQERINKKWTCVCLLLESIFHVPDSSFVEAWQTIHIAWEELHNIIFELLVAKVNKSQSRRGTQRARGRNRRD
jgi:hypothetical protein